MKNNIGRIDVERVDVFRASAIRQVTELINRYRGAYPLPVPARALYEATFPDWVVAETYKDRIRIGSGLSTQQYNLMMSLREGDILNYKFEKSEQREENTFWVRDIDIMLAPNEFLLVPDQFRQVLLKWHKEITRCEQEVHDTRITVAAALSAIDSFIQLQQMWPELAKVVRPTVVAPGPGHVVSARQRKYFAARVEPEHIKRAEELLAKCILMPETYLYNAWVGPLFE